MPKRTPATGRTTSHRRGGGKNNNKRLKQRSPSNNNSTHINNNTNLDYDSDCEPPDDERLDWRQNPEDSLSDWTIETIEQVEGNNSNNSSERKTNLFHVHKSMLAVGARKCEYFARLFLGEHFSEAQSAHSRIKLHPLAAKCFSDFLDYLYFDDLQITTENATSLHYLGRYFENRRLRWEAKQFWKRDMTLETMGTYCAHAAIFHDDKITDAVAEMCALQTDKITPDLSILQVSTPQLWLDVMERIPSSRSRSMSNILANFCATHAATIDANTFRELTSSANLPEIDAPVALALIDLERKLGASANPPAAAIEAVDDLLPSKNDNHVLSDLQHRCLTSLYSNWNIAQNIMQNQDGIQDSLCQQPSAVLVQLLASAQSDVLEVNKRLEEARGDLIRMQDELDDKDKELSRQRRIHMLAAASRRGDSDRIFYVRGSRGTAAQPLELSGEEQGDEDDDDGGSFDSRSVGDMPNQPNQGPRAQARRRWLELMEQEIDDSDSSSSSSSSSSSNASHHGAPQAHGNIVNIPADGHEHDDEEDAEEEDASVSSLESVGSADESAGSESS